MKLSLETKFLIIEDSLSYFLELKMLLENIGYKHITHASSSSEALLSLVSSKPDFIIMDIELNSELNGIDLGLKIKNLNIPILFITSFESEEYYSRAKEIVHYSYMIKPVRKIEFQRTIELLMENYHKDDNTSIDKESNSFYLKSNGVLNKISIDKILFIRSEGNYCDLITADKKYISRLTLKEFEKLLESKDFIKCHRRYIINVNEITSINFGKSEVSISDHIIPISRSAKALFNFKIIN